MPWTGRSIHVSRLGKTQHEEFQKTKTNLWRNYLRKLFKKSMNSWLSAYQMKIDNSKSNRSVRDRANNVILTWKIKKIPGTANGTRGPRGNGPKGMSATLSWFSVLFFYASCFFKHTSLGYSCSHSRPGASRSVTLPWLVEARALVIFALCQIFPEHNLALLLIKDPLPGPANTGSW